MQKNAHAWEPDMVQQSVAQIRILHGGWFVDAENFVFLRSRLESWNLVNTFGHEFRADDE